MDKIILVNKEKGMTSFDVVSACRKIFHEKSIGHTGTLDPNASGLLILLTGKYTKLLPYCVKDHKKYHAEFCFGKKTTTEDIWGEIVEENTPKEHTQEELDFIANSMLGESIQIPPMYSAIKVNGKKLYEYAREGIEVDRPAREIDVSLFSVKKLADNLFSLDCIVSSGTYVRTLIQDYASKLGEIGTMTSLVRESIENISLTDATTLEEIRNGHLNDMKPLDVLDPSYEIIPFEDEMTIKNGKKIKLDHAKDTVILVKDDIILAAYHKEIDGYYHSQRGLF